MAKVEEPGDKPSTIVKLLFDQNVVNLSSYLIARLEYIKFDLTRKGVFMTTWADELFHFGLQSLSPEKSRGFNINSWYDGIVSPEDKKGDWKFAPHKHMQPVETNWMLHMLKMESEIPGFMLLLHNVMKIEENAHNQLAEKSKKEDEYDFLGVGERTKATQQLLDAPRVARITHK